MILQLTKIVMETNQSLEKLEQKISEYNLVARYLLAYQTDKSIVENHISSIEMTPKNTAKVKEQLAAFFIAEKELAKRHVSPDISSGKVVDLVKQYQTQEKRLKAQRTTQQEKIQDFQAIVQLLDSFHEKDKENNAKLNEPSK